MLRPVKDENLAVDAERGDDVRILGLVASFVHFAGMLNLVNNVTLDGGNVSRLAVASNLPAILIIVVRIRRHGLGDLHIGNLEVVGAVVRGVRAQQQAVGAEVLAFHIFDIWEPLHCESRPSQGFAGICQFGALYSLVIAAPLTRESYRTGRGCSSSMSCTLVPVVRQTSFSH